MVIVAAIIISITTMLNTDRTVAVQNFVENNSGNMVFRLTDAEYQKLPPDLQLNFEKIKSEWFSKFNIDCEIVDEITKIFERFAGKVKCKKS
jgi:hypothetical protein